MNWKLFSAAIVSVLLTAFPQNIIGCGGTEDPYDYYTSFFSKGLYEEKGYRPFYYTSLLNFYTDWDNDPESDLGTDHVIGEWKEYTGGTATLDEVEEFVYGFSVDDLNILAGHISRKQPAVLSDALKKNKMTAYFINAKDLNALAYLTLAKQVESYSVQPDAWSPAPKGDSLEINRYIGETEKQFKQNGNPFLKRKYGFLRCKLAFYNNRFADCIRWYEEAFPESDKSPVKELALGYKAGSLFRLGKSKEATMAFAEAFARSSRYKQKHFQGFYWASNNADKKLESVYVNAAKTNTEKANLIALYALHGSSPAWNAIKKVKSLDPASPLLPILASREINKLEEQYLTPRLRSEKGGKPFYFTWENENRSLGEMDSWLNATLAELETLSNDNSIRNRAIYKVGTAYLYFIKRNYPKAESLAAEVSTFSTTQRIKDQAQLIRLLVMANDQPKLDASREQKLLPLVKWLKAQAELNTEYKIFYRNFFSEILAQKYQQQGDVARAALALGVADLHSFAGQEEEEYYFSSNGIDFVRNDLTTAQVLTLNNLFESKTPSPFLSFLKENSSFTHDKVIDVIGTSYLRDYNFSKAIEWLNKSKNKETLTETYWDRLSDKENTLNIDPFHDYLNDWQRYEKKAATAYTKLSFAQKMLDMENQLKTAKGEDLAKLYYRLASAFYNMSYYGNAWMAVAYYRSGSDWNPGKFELPWMKEYYTVSKARTYYQKAYELSTNKEFKAAAFFLVAKCAQRQIPSPKYGDISWEEFDKQRALFQKKFKNNPLFGQFKREFGNTQFYKYAYNRCSYLRDFKE